ncbi:inter-alpha-trypsin inhibitor-like [Engystomops pustulosus]|uniref:inter-alpha-trypsin inhibitor-like n=1 Tax=Engystomops pustulosus TaxID=76066 RepID=UPI003AFAE196
MGSVWIFLGLLLVGVTRAQESRCVGAVPEDPSGTAMRWTYDSSHDMCKVIRQKDSTFDINIFSSEQDCLKTCSAAYMSLYPDGAAVCDLPEDQGPCLAMIVMWYYNKERQVCDTFIYGGCQGNGNRFDSSDECVTRCVVPKKGRSGVAQDSEASGSGTDAGLIIGIVFGVIFGGAFLVTLALYLVQRKKLKKQQHKRVPDTEMK